MANISLLENYQNGKYYLIRVLATRQFLSIIYIL